MSLVFVKTKPGRRAFADPGMKDEIPSDRFVPIVMNPHVHRLIYVHQDIEVQQASESAQDGDQVPAAIFTAATQANAAGEAATEASAAPARGASVRDALASKK